MNILDVKTLLIVYVVITAICFIVVFSLWLQNRRHYPEILLWLIDYAIQFFALILVVLRNIAPDLVSIVLANFLIIYGLIILYKGLCRHLGKKDTAIYNYIVLAGFTLIHIHFTYVYPGLAFRNVNLSSAMLFICVRGSLLMFRHGRKELVPATRMTGVVMIIFCIACTSHIIANLVMDISNDIFKSGFFDALVLLEYQILFILLTFSLLLLVSRRLYIELETELAERRAAEEKFSKAFQTSPYGVVISRLEDRKFIEVNDAFESLTGYTRDEVINRSSLDIRIWVNEDDRDQVMSEVLAGKNVYGRELLFRRKDGEILTGLFSTQKIQIGGETCILSSINNITERKKVEEQLHKQSRFLSDLIEHSGTLICVKNPDGTYVLVNSKWEETTGLKRQDVIGKTDEELFPGEAGRQFRRNDLEVIESGTIQEIEEILDTGQGRQFFISIKFPVINDNGKIEGLCGMITDITERKMTEEKIKHLATHDVLTDLPTLRLASDRLEMAINAAMRHRKKSAVMFIDLDGFKTINDTLGHDAGDYVLKEAAGRMLSCVRHTDTVARVGGDEFLVISTELNSAGDAAQIAENLIRGISQPITLDNQQVVVGASIGIAVYPDHSLEMKDLIKKADAAMYRVKNSGKNSFAFAES